MTYTMLNKIKDFVYRKFFSVPFNNTIAKARKVADVSGAGDTVISTLTMALTAGADIYDAAYLANYAGGLVCQEVGIVPIDLNVLFNAVKEELP